VGRLVPTVVAALGAAGLLAAFQSSPGAPVTPASPASPVSTGAASPTTTAPATVPTTAGAAPPPTRRGIAPHAGTSTTPTTTGVTAPGSTPAPTTFDGTVEQNRYGPVQVRITVSGGHLTDVQALQLPSDRARSVRISQIAGPLLRKEALQAQSARIDVVSGATYTSRGYTRSLQHALDRAGI
jgi:uncharacterized protein with FMN-binding domain